MNNSEMYSRIYDEVDRIVNELSQGREADRQTIEQFVKDTMLDEIIENERILMGRDKRLAQLADIRNRLRAMQEVQAQQQITQLRQLLESCSTAIFTNYNYNFGQKDVIKAVDMRYKGRKFSDRIWKNERKVHNDLYKELRKFIDGKTSINAIRGKILKIFDNGQYNTRRLVNTEVARVASYSFDRFCKETGVKRVRRNAELDKRTCPHCEREHNKEYKFKDKPELPEHPLCRCFYDIIE